MGFVATEEFEFMKSDDPLFRPCQMLTGPDGAIYVVDWRTDRAARPALGRWHAWPYLPHHLAGTKEQPALQPRPLDSWSKIVKQDDDDLSKSLGSENASDRNWPGARSSSAARGCDPG